MPALYPKKWNPSSVWNLIDPDEEAFRVLVLVGEMRCERHPNHDDQWNERPQQATSDYFQRRGSHRDRGALHGEPVVHVPEATQKGVRRGSPLVLVNWDGLSRFGFIYSEEER